MFSKSKFFKWKDSLGPWLLKGLSLGASSGWGGPRQATVNTYLATLTKFYPSYTSVSPLHLTASLGLGYLGKRGGLGANIPSCFPCHLCPFQNVEEKKGLKILKRSSAHSSRAVTKDSYWMCVNMVVTGLGTGDDSSEPSSQSPTPFGEKILILSWPACL